MSQIKLIFLAVVGTFATACGPSDSEQGDDAASSGAHTGAEMTEPAATSGSPPLGDSTTAADSGLGTMDEGTTLPPNDDDDGETDGAGCGVSRFTGCDPLAEDELCDDGQVCTFDYSPKSGNSTFACGCDLGQAGPYEPCEYTYDPGDSCAPHQLCRADKCWPLCNSSLCPTDSVCLASICFENCDPLGPATCPDTLACQPLGDGFACSSAAAPLDDRAELGEPCLGAGGCAHGLVCTPAETVSGCEGEQCCTNVCATESGDPCVGGQLCVGFGDAGRGRYGACQDSV